jgi:hypothetical protein
MRFVEPENKDTQTSTSAAYWIWSIVLVLLAVGASAFWWAPRFLSKLDKPQPPVVCEPQPNIEPLQHEIAQLKSEITTLRDQVRQTEQKPTVVQNPNIALLAAFMDLKMVIRTGTPYTKELTRLKQLTPENTLPLDDYAAYGIPKLSYLVMQFKLYMDDLETPTSTETHLTFWDNVKVKLKSLVKIKKIQPEQTDPYGLTPLLQLIKQGEIAAVLTQLDQKNLPASKTLQNWKIHAEAYVNAEKKLDELMQKLFMSDQK